MVDDLTKEDIDTVKHMLGIGTHIPRKQWGYRNFFAASPSQLAKMNRLANGGYVTKGYDSGILTYYHATDKAMDAIGMSKAAKKRAKGD